MQFYCFIIVADIIDDTNIIHEYVFCSILENPTDEGTLKIIKNVNLKRYRVEHLLKVDEDQISTRNGTTYVVHKCLYPHFLSKEFTLHNQIVSGYFSYYKNLDLSYIEDYNNFEDSKGKSISDIILKKMKDFNHRNKACHCYDMPSTSSGANYACEVTSLCALPPFISVQTVSTASEVGQIQTEEHYVLRNQTVFPKDFVDNLPNDYSKATRAMLRSKFSRDDLAKSSLTGKPSRGK